MPRNSLRRVRVTATSALALTFLATACSGGAADGAGSADSKPVRGGTLTYVTDRQEACIDPQVGGDLPQATIAHQITDNLVYEDAKGEIQPWLAKKWTISPDGLTYTFTLRDDVKFTDGTRFDAAAVKANLDRVVDPATESSTDGGYIKPFYKNSVAVSDYVLKVDLKKKDGALLHILAQSYIGIQSPAGFKRGKDANCKAPIGTGPFKVEKYVSKDEVRLVRNDDYRTAPPESKNTKTAYLDRLIFKVVPEGQVRYAALTNKQADVIYLPPPQLWKTIENNPSQALFSKVRAGSPVKIDLSTRTAPFTDVRVRRAFRFAANEKAALKSAYFDTYDFVGGPLSAATPFYDPAFETAYAHHPKKAAALLDQAGWTGRDAQGYRTKNGKQLRVEIVYPAAMIPAEDITEIQNIQAAEKEAGVNVVLKPGSEADFNAAWAAHDFGGLAGGYWTTNTPDVLRTLYSTEGLKTYGTNATAHSDPALDKVLQQALDTQDDARRTTLYAQAQQIVSDAALQVNLHPAANRLAYNKTVHGLTADNAVALPDFREVWVTK